MNHSGNFLIPAIKRGDKYLDLVTMEESISIGKYSNHGITFTPKADFSL